MKPKSKCVNFNSLKQIFFFLLVSGELQWSYLTHCAINHCWKTLSSFFGTTFLMLTNGACAANLLFTRERVRVGVIKKQSRR